MRYLIRVAMSFALLLCASSLAWSSSPAQEPKETGTITGRVTVDRKPAQDVTVMAIPTAPDVGTRAERRMPNPSTFRKAVTDSDGRYRLEAVPTGKYYVAPFAPEYSPDSPDDTAQQATVKEGATVQGVDFALCRGGVMTGRVTDSEGHPVVAADIAWKRVDPTKPEASLLRSERIYFTDDRGIYRIFGLRPGRYIVRAGTSHEKHYRLRLRHIGKVQTYYPGFTDEAKAKPVEVAAGMEASGVDIKFGAPEKRFAVSGLVIDAETRTPIAKAIVAYSAREREGGPDKRENDEGATTTNERGEFRFDSLSPGNYKAEAGSIGRLTGVGAFYADPINFEVGSANVDKLEIKTHLGASITGVVVVENSQGGAALDNLASFRLVASYTDTEMESSSSRWSNVASDGGFRIGGLKPGKAKVGSGPYAAQKFSVLRTERNGVEQPDGIDIQPNEQITGVRVIVVRANCVIRGHVTIQGGPLPIDRSTDDPVALKAVARPLNVPRGDSYKRVPVDAKGDFVIENLTPGDYEVDVAGTYLNESFHKKHIASTKQTVSVVGESPAQVALVLDVSAKEPDK
jgi:protocatechuate 3,4-dioxygenase beta subunit